MKSNELENRELGFILIDVRIGLPKEGAKDHMEDEPKQGKEKEGTGTRIGLSFGDLLANIYYSCMPNIKFWRYIGKQEKKRGA